MKTYSIEAKTHCEVDHLEGIVKVFLPKKKVNHLLYLRTKDSKNDVRIEVQVPVLRFFKKTLVKLKNYEYVGPDCDTILASTYLKFKRIED